MGTMLIYYDRMVDTIIICIKLNVSTRFKLIADYVLFTL